MSDSKPDRNEPYRFRLLSPALYLDSLLFWSIYVSSTMVILWLLASTAKNQIREIKIDELVAIKSQTIEIVQHYQQLHGAVLSSDQMADALNTIAKGNTNVLAMGVVRQDADGSLNVVGEYSKTKTLAIDFTSNEHVVYVGSALTENRMTISDWELFTSGSATLLTPASAPIEYLYAVIPQAEGDRDQQFLIVAIDAMKVQYSFYKVEELGITAICLSILLATLIAILIRYRSAQRLEATEGKLTAMESLRKRDKLLSLVVGAADELLGQQDVDQAFRELLVKLKSELNLYGLMAVIETAQHEIHRNEKKYTWINPQGIDSIPIGFGGEGELLPEWQDALKRGDSVVIRRREAPALFRSWMASHHIHLMALVALHREGYVSGLVVALEKTEKNILDPGLVGTLKLSADIFSAAYQQRRQEGRMLESSKMEALGRVAGGVAHEFNNLLHIITGNLRTSSVATDKRELDVVQREKILEAAGRGSRIVEQLLRATRLNVPNLAAGNLNALIEKTVSLARLAVGAGITIETKYTDDLPAVLMDEGQIQQVILNLILNARDAIKENGTICIQTARRDAFVVCEVMDDGQGIPEELLDRLFEPFFTTKEPGKGTGLGLSTSRGILEQHAGTIEADNAPAGGGIFRFYLPVTEAAETPVVDALVTHELALKPSGQVLIADDEQMCREVLIACLEEKGISTKSFNDGQQLLDYIHQTQDEISWVITDWTMPGLHGEALIRSLRESRDDMKIFVTSGFVLETDKIPRVDGLINKPFGPEELFQVLAKSLVLERR